MAKSPRKKSGPTEVQGKPGQSKLARTGAGKAAQSSPPPIGPKLGSTVSRRT